METKSLGILRFSPFLPVSLSPCLFAAAILLAGSSPAVAQPPAGKPKSRQVFVLHSGLHTILSNRRPNWATEIIQQNLLDHGVPQDDIVLLDCPFPEASWKNMFPRDGLNYYLESFQPASSASQQSYRILHQALLAHGVRKSDKLIWIGHSAGGQIGLTMAHLGASLAEYPALAADTKPYAFDMVVTLGTPVGSELLPATVKQRHYFSPQDRVVRWACSYGPFALSFLGQKVQLTPVPQQMKSSSMVRIFQGVEHPYWPDERVILRILAEYRPSYQPVWRCTSALPTVGRGLSNLLCQALEEESKLSFEDPFE